MTETAQPDRQSAGDHGALNGMAGWQLHSMHRTSRGTVTYASCPCGAWLVLLDGKPLATSGLPLSTGKCKHNVEQLAQAVATNGRSTDRTNTNAAHSYRNLGRAAEDGLV